MVMNYYKEKIPEEFKNIFYTCYDYRNMSKESIRKTVQRLRQERRNRNAENPHVLSEVGTSKPSWIPDSQKHSRKAPCFCTSGMTDGEIDEKNVGYSNKTNNDESNNLNNIRYFNNFAKGGSMKKRKKENEFYNTAMEEEIARCDEVNDIYGNQRETFKNIIDMTKRISNIQQTLRTTINDIEDREFKREVKLYLSIMQKETKETKIRPDIMDNVFKPSLRSELKIEN